MNSLNSSFDPDIFYKQAFSRNIGLFSEIEQDKLKSFRVGIVGAGGVGGAHLINLVRLGIGKFSIADMDVYELVNIQRQYGAHIDTLGKNKAQVMEKIALSINPHLDIKVFSKGLNSDNLDEFLADCDLVIDGIDFFCIEERRMFFSRARELGLYTITAGPLGFGSAVLIFSPTGMSFDKYFDLNDGMSNLEKIIAFAVGLAPAALHMKYIDLGRVDIKSKTGPALVSACNLCSALASTEAMRILLNRNKVKAAPYYFQFDPYTQTLKKGKLLWANRNPIQKLKRWFLTKKFAE